MNIFFSITKDLSKITFTNVVKVIILFNENDYIIIEVDFVEVLLPTCT